MRGSLAGMPAASTAGTVMPRLPLSTGGLVSTAVKMALAEPVLPSRSVAL